MPTIIITADYDGTAFYDSAQGYVKEDTYEVLSIGYDSTKDWYRMNRAFPRFSLDSLPAGVTVTQVRRYLYCTVAGGASHLIDDHAYGSNGQQDPQADGAYTCYERCASGNLYQNDSDELRYTGGKWATLGGSICADVQAAKAAVNRFALAIHEEGDNDPTAQVYGRLHGLNQPQLEITYEEAPPPAIGYQYSDGLVSIQVAG